MYKIKKIRLMVMAIVFSLLLSNVAMAHNRYKDKYKDKSYQEKCDQYSKQYKTWHYKYNQRFKDVEKEHWANKYIDRMAAKKLIVGDGNGWFIPNNPTKTIEAIVMTIRIMGWEDDAKAIKELPDDLEDLDVPEWAVGYVALAYKKGIILEDEIDNFNTDEAAKRYIVAKYIIRALGLEEKALDYIEEVLDFEDATSIPEGNRGYVYLIHKLGLMSGYRKIFNPNGCLTRAEMATLFSRLDDKIESEKDEVEMGDYVQTVNGIITIEEENEQERYLLSEDVMVYDVEGKEITLEQLTSGDKLQLEFFDHKVVYIEVIKEEVEKVLKIYEGKVLKLLEASVENAITIEVDGKEKTFVFDNEKTIIKKDNDDDVLQVSHIQVGDTVKVTEVTEGDEVAITEIEIQVLEPITQVYEGTVVSLAQTTTEKLMTIHIKDEEKTFVIGEDTLFKMEGQDEALVIGDIHINDDIKVTEVTKGDDVNVTIIEKLI